METIQWQMAAPGSWYYQFDRFMFKKKKLSAGISYQIWEYGSMRYNTQAERDFLIKASYVLCMGHFDMLV